MNSFIWSPRGILRTETERFIIRSIQVQEIDDVYISWWNDTEIQLGLNMPARDWGKAEAVKHVSRFDNLHAFHLGIYDKSKPNEKIGFFTIFNRPGPGTATTNVVIGDKSFWGENVVLEVRAHMLKFIFNQLGALKIKGEISGRNLPSIYNYQAQGFKNEGVLRAELPHPTEDRRVDKYLFGLLKDEWLLQLESNDSDTSATND